jgi:hypothetical protein
MEFRMTVRCFILPAAVAATLTAFSASVDAAEVRARVPFGFMVRDRAFAPGRCLVSIGGNLQGVAAVRAVVAAAFAGVQPLQSASAEDPKLVFYKYGDKHVLREVWLGGRRGYRLLESAMERQLRENARSRNVVLTFDRVVVPGS